MSQEWFAIAFGKLIQLESSDGFRREREMFVEVGEVEFTIRIDDLEFAAFEDGAVVIAENGQEDFVFEQRIGRVPIDIEVRGEI